MTTVTLYLDRLDAVIFDVDSIVKGTAEAHVYGDTVRVLRELRLRYVPTAAVSSSRHRVQVLHSAGVAGLLDVRVDGADLDRLGLPGKPFPAAYQEAARRLGARPAGCAVVEDAVAGVRAGHTGGFGVVIGVDRGGDLAGALYDAGATVVVSSMSDVLLVERTPLRLVQARRGQADAVWNDRPVIWSQ
ncbi:HAD family hydrolase [Jiangella mangrovi]|uniref:HAD superfamily hydrolase (TIGR01509 family) n=1 Tax=Jiangella mangrovi TaxID=1524084 RepID=A0A7W9GRL8_9ACTN|nr:HAD-IA family hydrolase [Jiangella mangrovi]MBB5788778.1 HAD superfamily hydrolase (TIGR01509 family) [Jiangella mangrovi]